MLRRSRGGHWYRPPTIRIAALEKAAPQHPRTEPDGVTGSSPAVQCSACAPAATPQTDTRVSASPVAAAAGASVSEENASPAQLPREDSGYCAVEGWSISSALLSVFVLAPTIAGHCCGSRTSFQSFMSAMTHLLPVPETHTRQVQLCSPSSDRAPAMSSSSSTSGLLFDALTLPCHVCRHASPFSARLATPWAEWVTQGRGSGQHPLQSPMPPSRWCNPPLSPPVSAGEENASSSPAATREPTVWTTKSMYADAQVCADASADDLRTFTSCRLHQRVPQLQLLAERPYAMGDEAVEGCAAPRDVADAAETACAVARNAEQLSLATRRVPVETYVERTLLSRTTGTAALQLALRRALQSPSTAAWWKAETATTKDDCSELAAMAPAASHLLWNGRDWTLEVDPQLVEMEERLLQAQQQQSNKNTRCEGSDTLMTRAWLRSHYPPSSVTVLMPPVQTSGAEIASPLGAWPGGCSVFPADPLPHDPQSGGNLVARDARCGSLLTPCASWIFRLRKSWLVTGLHSHMPHRACVSDAHASGEDNNNSSNSSSVFGASFSQRMPQVNYDLLTGAPLRLKWQRSTRGKWEIVPAAAPERRQKIKEEAMHEQPASVNASCNNVTDSSVCDAVQQQCQPPPPSPLSPVARCFSSPFSYAIRSRRVGWMPVKRTRPFAPEKNTAAPTTSVTWSLPPALHAFDLPTNPASVPEPLLTDHDPQDPTSLCCGAVVPREEWYTGFFAHDAPAWWERAVSSALRRSAATICQLPSQQVQGNCEDTACAQNNADKFEKDALLAPPHLLQRLIDLGYVPALPDETISASQAEPLLCVLQLRAAAPRVRRDQLCESMEEKGGGGGGDVHLCWSIHDGTTATATVNFAFTLADVSSGGTELTLSSTPSPALCFVELKAGLEVLRRVTHGSESACGVQSVASTSWWSRLECFYQLNTAEMSAVERQAAQTQETSSTRHNTLSGVGPDTLQSARGGTSRGYVTAASHPSTTEVAQKLLRFIAAGDHTEAREQIGEEEEDEKRAEIITQHGGEQQKEEEKWESASRDGLARSGGAAARAFAMHWRRSEQHDRLHRTLAALSTAESPTTPHAEKEADTGERELAEDVAESASVQLLPFGVEVHTYDEDGTRIYEAERSQHAEDVEGEDEEETEDDRDADEETLTAATREAATAAAASASSPADSGSSSVRHPSLSICGGTTRDWPALDRRCFAQRHHRLEDAMKPPGRSHHPVQSMLRHEQRQQNQKASTTPDAAPPRLCLPLSPPISVSALGIDRALAITAAQAETKRYGYLSTRLQRQSPAALPSMFHQHHLLQNLFSDTAAAAAVEENAVRPVEEENQVSCHEKAHSDSREGILGATRPTECSNFKVAESSTPLSRTCAHTSLVGPPAAYARSASTTLSEQSVRMDLDSTATLLPDLFSELIRDERRRFKDLWRPWLSYLPPENSAPSAVGSATHDADEAFHVVPPRDPRWIFPFLQTSRVEACHIRQTQQKSADQTPPLSPAHTEKNSDEGEFHRHLLNPHVVAYDIGISLLQIRTNDTYVNAFNLLLRDSPRRPPTEAKRTT